MKILLIKDVYKLGRAGDVKKVANGYGRNYLIPQGMAVLATPGSLSQAERIRKTADVRRVAENEELSGLTEQLSELQLIFAANAGDTGKLYGSITTTMISDAIKEATEAEVERRQIDTQPIRMLGVHKVNVRLTMDLIPEITVVVHREGEPPESAFDLVEGVEAELTIDETTDELETAAEGVEESSLEDVGAGESSFEESGADESGAEEVSVEEVSVEETVEEIETLSESEQSEAEDETPVEEQTDDAE
jgi:large subunit ribosomal protein L9